MLMFVKRDCQYSAKAVNPPPANKEKLEPTAFAH